MHLMTYLGFHMYVLAYYIEITESIAGPWDEFVAVSMWWFVKNNFSNSCRSVSYYLTCF